MDFSWKEYGFMVIDNKERIRSWKLLEMINISNQARSYFKENNAWYGELNENKMQLDKEVKLKRNTKKGNHQICIKRRNQ